MPRRMRRHMPHDTMCAHVSGQHLPPDHDLGDEHTIGGYALVHGRPAAFEGGDGFSYSVELCVDQVNDAGTLWAGYILFPRWRRIGASGVEGHLETDYLTRGNTRGDARDALASMTLQQVRDALEQRIAATAPAPTHRWFDVMRDERDGDPRAGEAP